MEEFSLNIVNLSAVLLAAYLGGLLIKKIGYPAILGELIVGIILGPGLLGILELTASIKVLSEIGIIMLMVYIGMEINFHDLKKASWPGLLAAFGGFFVPFFLGYYTIVMYGGTPLSGVFVAIAIGVTSLATKSRILVDLKLLNTRIAYVLMAGALISDTLALVIFSGIINFAESNSISFQELALISGKIITFFAITISIGIFVLPRLGKLMIKSKVSNSTLYFTLILIITFGYCELAELAGMHSILGAFMAGLFLKDNIFRKNISKELHKSFYDISIGFMAPIFFVSAGFSVDLNVFKTDLGLLFLITGLAIVGKIVGTALFYIPSKNGWREGLTIGTGMNGRGAVEIIIAEIGLNMGIINNTIFSILVFMAIFTTLTVPVLLSWTTNWLRNRNELVYMVQKSGYLILAVNPISLFVARYLSKNGNVTFIDNNMEMASLAKAKGYNSLHGNILNTEFLSENVPEDISTFIGFTANSEINLQGGVMAQDSLLIPNLSLALSKTEVKGNKQNLDERNIGMAPVHTSEMESWCQHIQHEEFNEVKEEISADTTTKSWLKEKQINVSQTLPLLVKGESGEYRMFHKNDSLTKGEKIIMLQKTEV